ncbi:hypothetical protein Droror1_Dr00016469 [Drosera rotundifolia]
MLVNTRAAGYAGKYMRVIGLVLGKWMVLLIIVCHVGVEVCPQSSCFVKPYVRNIGYSACHGLCPFCLRFSYGSWMYLAFNKISYSVVNFLWSISVEIDQVIRDNMLYKYNDI